MSSSDGDGQRDGDGGAPSGDVLHRIRQKLVEQLQIVQALELTLKILTEGSAPPAAVVKAAVAASDGDGDGAAAPKRQRRPATPAARRTRRQQSADFLALFNPHTPYRPSPAESATKGLGVYVRRGYLEKKGNRGWIRTAKEFTV